MLTAAAGETEVADVLGDSWTMEKIR